MNSELLMKIENLPPLCQSLPYLFEDSEGSASGKIDEINCNCERCGQNITSANIRGEFVKFNVYSVSLDAYAICIDCQVITPIVSKFSPDGSMMSKDASGWSKGTWGSKPKAGWGGRIKAFFIGEKNHE